MGLLDNIVILAVINAARTMARIGGALMRAEAVAAMIGAEHHFIDLSQAQFRPGV